MKHNETTEVDVLVLCSKEKENTGQIQFATSYEINLQHFVVIDLRLPSLVLSIFYIYISIYEYENVKY